jgi:tRNA pseudouridine38-40 synthase
MSDVRAGPGLRQTRVEGVLTTLTLLRTLKLTVEYDGTNYVGWQRQAEGTSIQGLIEWALAPFEGGPVTVHGAGRTDAGVHALAQVASVRTRTEQSAATLQRALNAVLPIDVRVIGVEDAPPGFHARFDAASKTYEYRIATGTHVSAFHHRYVWHVPGVLDVDAMRAGAKALRGRHDFAAFRSTGGAVHTTERTILAITVEAGSDRGQTGVRPGPGGQAPLVITVTGDGFLRHMVRTIAGTLADVGLGRWPPGQVSAILASRNRARAGRAAPAAGLFLVRVDYP